MRSAFSMVELLIAIMILGLGLTMVATIFPVGLDMTRQTVETSLALAAAESAVEIVKLKVPTYHDEILTVQRTGWTSPAYAPVAFLPRSLILPGDPQLDLFKATVIDDCGIENNANIENFDSWANTSMEPAANRPFADVLQDTSTPPVPLPMFNIFPSFSPTDRLHIAQRSRIFTEHSFWDSDPPIPLAGEVTSLDTTLSYILRGENVPVDWQQRFSKANALQPILVTDVPPAIDGKRISISGVPQPETSVRLGRLHLTDHVYPPLPYATATIRDFVKDFAATPDTRWTRESQLAQSAVDRRYSWTIIHRRLAQDRAFALTVVVTSRGELNSSFAYQQDQRSPKPVYGTPYDLSLAAFMGAGGPGLIDSIFLPVSVTETERAAMPAPPNTLDLQDGLFPRPWLVALGLPPGIAIPPKWQILPSGAQFMEVYNGKVLCTAEVARLLPAGAHFVVASGAQAGQVFHVSSSSPDLSQLGQSLDQQTPTQLTVEGLPNLPMNDPVQQGDQRYIWVFPPAVVLHPPGGTNGKGDFGARSPVVAAFEREVTLP